MDRMQDDAEVASGVRQECSGATGLIYTVMFLGMLLSFTIYVFITMLLGTDASFSETYWDSGNYQMPLSGYNDAYYKNREIQSVITQYDYLLFDKTESRNVLVGRNSFLFPVFKEDGNYNYLRDFLGEYSYGSEGLENIYNAMLLRKMAYANQGVEYVVAVIPNAQTVYSELMPAFIRGAKGESRLSLLTEYMRTKNDITFIDLTDALLAAKDAGVLYNNTENSLNSLGEYFVYQALYQALPEGVRAGTQMISFDEVDFYTHYTDGKALSKQAGLSSVVENRTISLSSSMEFNYQLQELFSGVEITSANHLGERGTAGQSILLEFSDDWNKIALMPYFSGTFDDVAYKSNHEFSKLAVDSVHPAVVIQFVTEDELGSLTNSNISLSYNAGLSTGENPFITTSPVVTGQVMLDEHAVCLTGLVEDGAELSVYGDENYRVVQTQGGQFFVTVEVPGDEVLLRLQASLEDKSRSEIVKVTVRRTEFDADADPIGTLVGADSRLFRAVYEPHILPDTGTASVMESELIEYRQKIDSFSPEKKTEFINVIIPEALSVYAEQAPETLAEDIENCAAYRERIAEIYRQSGYTVVDLCEALSNKVSEGKLYRVSEDKLTDLGAYYGYVALMEYIKQTWQGVRPCSPEDYIRVTQSVQGGELVTGLGFDAVSVSETLVRMRLTSSALRYERINSGGDGSFATFVADSSLPVAVVLYDEEGSLMLSSMAQNFRVMIALPMGKTEVSEQLLTLFQPDYVIRLSSERTPGLYDWNNTEESGDAS